LQFLKRSTEALERYEAALAFYREIGDRLGEANVLQELAKLQSDPRQGLEALQTAQDIYEQIGDKYSQSRNLFFISERQIKCGEIDAAILSLHQAEAIAIEIDYEPFISYSRQQIAQLSGGFMGGLTTFIHFAQRGWLQFILCFLLGLFTFPFLLIAAAVIILWRFLQSLTANQGKR
jgi:tetratricopeptide (TPR) repeat protein